MAQRARSRGVVIGRAFGAPIILHWSTVVWVGIIILITVERLGESSVATVATGATYAAVILASILLHELAHAAVARLGKRRVKEVVLTLMGGHTTFDARGLTPAVSGTTAAAGPAANAIIAIAAWWVASLGVPAGARDMLTLAAQANAILAIFNALPGLPMDGGKLFEAIVWRVTGRHSAGMRAAAWGGRVVAVALVIYVLAGSRSQGGAPDLVALVWAFILFGVLWPESTAALRAARTRDHLDATSVRRIMRSAVGVPYDVSFAQALDAAGDAEHVVVLSRDGHPAGHFPADADLVPPKRRASTSLSAVTVPLPRGALVDVDLGPREALTEVRAWWGRADVLAVMDGDRVVGVVRLAEVLDRLQK